MCSNETLLSKCEEKHLWLVFEQNYGASDDYISFVKVQFSKSSLDLLSMMRLVRLEWGCSVNRFSGYVVDWLDNGNGVHENR